MATFKRMYVCVVQTRKCHATGEIDRQGINAGELRDRIVVANCDDLAVRNGRGLRPGTIGIDRIDAAIHKNDIGWFDRRVALTGQHRCRGGENQSESYNSSQLFIPLRLKVKEMRILSVLGQQTIVRTTLENLALMYHDDLRSSAYRRESMRDKDRHFAAARCTEMLEDFRFR